MKEFTEDRNLILYAEGLPDMRHGDQEEILRLLASSAELRSHLARIRRDLYLVECKIPEYHLSPEFLMELNKLAEVWSKLRASRRFRLYHFLMGKEFLSLSMLLIMLLVMTLLLLWIR